MSGVLIERAYAKINLALHVRAQRDDGYHDLETVFAFCADGDVISVEAAEISSLTIAGRFGNLLNNSDNLVTRAAALFVRPAAIRLDKHLPVASGIGGGSADAAAVMRVLARLFDVPLPSVADQRALGADVPACVLSTTQRGEGTGEVLRPGPDVTGLRVLLVNPCIALSTGAVFGGWDGIDGGPLGDWRAGRNDLEPAAMALVPEVTSLLDWLKRRDNVLVARMSGSGATCFALFTETSAQNKALAEVQAAFPDYWVMESVLR